MVAPMQYGSGNVPSFVSAAASGLFFVVPKNDCLQFEDCVRSRAKHPCLSVMQFVGCECARCYRSQGDVHGKWRCRRTGIHAFVSELLFIFPHQDPGCFASSDNYRVASWSRPSSLPETSGSRSVFRLRRCPSGNPPPPRI